MNSLSKREPRRRAAGWALLIGLCVSTGTAIHAATFDEQRQAVSAALTTQPESAIIALLEAGIAESKPTQAGAIAQQWLRGSVAEDARLLYLAGRAAELSGDWTAAAALYRQYLKRADLKSSSAADAILGAYTLLLDKLADSESAYAFSRSEGHRLVAAAQARQFDAWFLEEAIRRKDAEAVADRLRALVEAGVPNDLLILQYEAHIRWLLGAITNWRLDEPRFSDEFAAASKALARGIHWDEDLRRRLDWEVSVKHYNMSVLAGVPCDPPLAEARAWLALDPTSALRVQTGWAGGHRGQHYRGKPDTYWSRDREAKIAVLSEAMARLDPVERAHFWRSWENGYYVSGPSVLGFEESRRFVLEHPQEVNSRLGPRLSFDWTRLSSAQAGELAPHLQANPSPEASLVRIVAALGDEKNFDQAIALLIGEEAWRLGPQELGGIYADRLWHWAGRPGNAAMRDQGIAKAKALVTAMTKDEVRADAPLDQRMAAFKRLWADYRAPKPQIPNVYSRLVQIVQRTPEALPELFGDASPEARLLLRDAIEAGVAGNDPVWSQADIAAVSTREYAPCLDKLLRYRRVNDVEQLKQRHPQDYKAHPLEPMLRQQVTEQLKRGKLDAWLVMAWLNVQFPDDKGATGPVIASLSKAPVWAKMPFEIQYGARAWFGPAAMTEGQMALTRARDAALVCTPLASLSKDADAAAVVAALDQLIRGLQASPTRLPVLGLDRLSALPDAVFSDAAVQAKLVELFGSMRVFDTEQHLGARLLAHVGKQRDAAALHALAAYLWRHTQVHHRTLADLIALTDAVTADDPSAGHTLARCGLQTFARYAGGHMYFNREADIPRLRGIRGKAAMAMGLIDIPVPATHPAYAIYQSQAEFVIGNTDTARQLYESNADQLLPVHRDLTVPYLLWVLQLNINSREEIRQEELAKALMAWMRQSGNAFTVEQQVALEIAYGDIAMQRNLLPEARKIYQRIEDNPAYEPVFERHTATLRRVLVERMSGDYDAALQTLLALEAKKISSLTTAAHFARAEVHYAREDYQEAADEITKVLERDPNHPDATILRGRVQLKLQRLIEATEIELGATARQASLVPGEVLKVTLTDPTLSVSGGSSDIEVEVWSTSGDKEYLLLRQFGDQKTKYRGEVRTALGQAVPDDRTLQVVGDDEIYYAYSQRFREKMPSLGENRGGPITVASDAVIMASARKLLSENEQRVIDMQNAMAILRDKDLSKDPDKAAQIKAEVAEQSRRAALRTSVKPGNPIYLRVADPDRSRTAQIDEVAVSVSTTSGDTIGRVVLKETEPYSGRFEGRVATVDAPPLAYASSSETGRHPNMVISPKADYPAWRPVTSKEAQHSFTVDLNDNVAIDQLMIQASDEGYSLKRFLVQTAIDDRSWTTVASHPASRIAVANPWQPSITVVNEEGRRAEEGARSVGDFRDLQQHLTTSWLMSPDMALARNVAGPTQALPESVLKDVNWQRGGRWPNPAVVARFQAYFHESRSVTRRFALQLGRHDYAPKEKKLDQPSEFLLAVDGRAIARSDHGKLEGEIDLKPGVHRLEIWATGRVEGIGFGRTVTLRANLDDPDTLVDCPDQFFDPAAFPPGVLEHRNSPAVIEAGDSGRAFDVRFAPESRARLIRLVFVESQGLVPSLNRLTLTSSDGRHLLPVAEDYTELRKNNQLEIVPGDTIAVRYVDDRHVTEGKQKHERFLTVAYTNGSVEFADIEPRFSSRHNSNQPYHEQLLRFVHDKPLPLVVHDADMDVSVEPDRVTCVLTTSEGERREVQAQETGASTGVFRGWITPVKNKAADEGQIQVAEGGTLTLTYRDAENLTPGVPYERVTSIQHAVFAPPRIEVSHMVITPRQADVVEGTQPLHERFDPTNSVLGIENRGRYRDRIQPRYQIEQRFVSADNPPEGGIEVVHGRHALFDVVVPHLALGAASTLNVYVQTDAGRAAHAARREGGDTSKPAFDLNVPGTMHIIGRLGEPDRSMTPERGGYLTVTTGQPGTTEQRAELSRRTGRFRLLVPLIAGTLPELSYAMPTDESADYTIPAPLGLVARTGERIHLGVSYTDEQGVTQWATASAKVITRPMLDVMGEDYVDAVTEAHVGETVNLRVVDLAMDRTGDRDTLAVYMAAKSGAKHHVTLQETDAHSGVFKGAFQLAFAQRAGAPAAAPDASDDADPGAAADDTYDVRRLGFPVRYGDAVAARYTDSAGFKTPVLYVQIAKGSDGSIFPFSKRYDDSDTAMRTQFAMAESYLELARRHRDLKEDREAEMEFSRAKQLLASTISQFSDPQTRAHAEYLLGNLTVEDAEATADEDLKRDRYQAALARFMKVTGTYPDTEFASKAQFRTAVVYERIGEPDIAAQEYVKLAYKYPDSEHLATAMARLGTHFQQKAVQLEKKAQVLLEKQDDQDAQFDGAATRKLARLEFIKAAQIFERLQTRFPGHELAGMAGLRAGQIYMRAEDYTSAVNILQAIIDNESYDGPGLRAEAMYWSGRCNQSLKQALKAYALFKRITYDFPESKWAAYARAELSSESLLELDRRMEIQRLEEGR